MNSKRAPRFRWLALLFVLALVTAACSGGSTTETTSPTDTETTSPTDAPGGGGGDALEGTLTYFSLWNEGEPQQVVLAGIIEDFEAAYPGVTVDVNWAGREVLTPTRAAISSGNSPDLVDLDAEPLWGALIKDGQTLGLGGVVDMEIPGDGGNTVGDVIPAAFLDIYARDGAPQMIPYELITSGIFYDEGNLSELGIDAPATWDEFLAAMGTASAAGQPGVQQDGLENYYNAYWLYWLIVREAGPSAFYDAASDPTGELWKSDALVTAARNLEAMVTSGAMAKGYDGSSWPLAQQAWAAGDGLFMINGTWLPSETGVYAAKGFDYRMIPFPQTDGGFDTAELYLIGWVVPSGSKNLVLAEAFMAFALQKDRLSGIASVAKNLTPRLDIPVPVEIQDAADIFASNPEVHRPYDGVQGDFPEYWNTVLLPLDDKLFFGQITADEFIEQISQATKEFWANQ